MAARFILGRSGTGKTSYCVRSVVEALLDEADDRPLLFLVPEQATFQAERVILSNYRIRGYNRLRVLSFDRLAYQLLGRNTARPTLSRVGEQMIIQRLLRANSGKLKIFGQLSGVCGLAQRMADAVSELCRYGKDIDQIDEFVEQLGKEQDNSLTRLKFADIAFIQREYLKFIEGKFIDPDIQLNSVRKAIGEAELVKGARLWVDGFAGFTGSELEILAELLKVCSETEIALCLDPTKKMEAGKIGGGFEPTEQTYIELLEIIKKCKVKLREPLILKKAVRFENAPALRHLEENFFELSSQQKKSGGAVRIIAAANARNEIEYIAKEIGKLIREKNYRYRDIAIIASNLDSYEHYIRGYLSDRRIPYFIDKRQSLDEHVVVKLVNSAVAAVTEGFDSSDIFSYLKTGLTGIDEYEIDALENYCIASGISGKDWTSEHKWQFAGPDDNEFDEEQVNKTRTKVAEPLVKLRRALGYEDGGWGVIRPGDFTKAVFGLLEELKVYQQLNRWVEKAVAEGRVSEIRRHQQFCDRFADVFDELAEAFAGHKLTCLEWSEIIGSGLSQMTLALIPPSLDQVLVGSIERSRHPDLKAVFVVGCTQKQFPVPVSYDGLLSESDRATAEANDFELGPGLRENLAQREYLAYIAFTRPSEFLYVSYPLLEGKSSPAVRSRFVSQLQSLFSDVHVESAAVGDSIEKVRTEGELRELLCSKLGRDSDCFDKTEQERLVQLLRDMSDDEQLAETAESVNSATGYENRAELDSQVVKELVGEQIKSSATKLSTFAACPYQYFARYELELKERKEFTFEPLDKGLFYHKVLDNLIKELNKRKIGITKLPDNELAGILRERIAELLRDDSFIRNLVGHSKHNAYIIASASDHLEGCVLDMAKMIGAGAFRPRLSEVLFGDYQIEMPNGQKLILRGKIDRLDEAKIDGEKYAIVFDYKLRGRRYSWSAFYNGLDMQLAIYMSAVRQSESEPLGAFFIPIEVSSSAGSPGKIAQQAEKFERKANGIFNGEYFRYIDGQIESRQSKFYNFQVSKDNQQYGDYGRSGSLKKDDFEKVLAFTRQKIIRLAGEIIAGRIEVAPYRLNNTIPCGYCKYKSVCRFDWQINNYRVLEPVDKKAVLEKI